MQPRKPIFAPGAKYVDSDGNLYLAVQAVSTIHQNCYALVDTNQFKADWCPPLTTALHLAPGQVLGLNDSKGSVFPRNYFWIRIITDNLGNLWRNSRGDYIIGADYAAGCQPMSAPDYFPRASLLIREGPKAWIISEFRAGWPVIPEHPVKWNQVLFDSAEVRCIPPEEWDALGLKPSAVRLFGSPVELYETHAMNNGPVNYWFVESVE